MLERISSAALLGAVIYFLSDQSILVRAITGAIFGAGAFVFVPAGIGWVLDLTSPVQVSLTCAAAVMPTKIPEGGYTTVHLYPGGGGSGVSYAEPGSATGYSGNDPAFRCEVRNQSGKELPALRITMSITYRPTKTPIDQDKLSGDISIIAPYLDARPEQPFAFYIPDPRDFAATISKIKVSYARPSSRDRAIKVTDNLIHPIAFGPAE